jgi:hypothetical protein
VHEKIGETTSLECAAETPGPQTENFLRRLDSRATDMLIIDSVN